MSVPEYDAPTVIDLPNSAAQVQALTDIQRYSAAPNYSLQASAVDTHGAIGQDLSAYLIRPASGGNDGISWDCTAPATGSLRVSLDAELSLDWGSDLMAVYQLIRSKAYNQAAGYDLAAYLRFPLGHYVLTTPGIDDLDAAVVRQVTGYDKNYLLQNAPADSFSFAFGSTYLAAVQAIFLAAGLITTTLNEVCDYSGAWSAKTLPSPQTFPLDGNLSYLDIVNQLLKASGCLPLYTQPSGRWSVADQTIAAQQPLRWRWAASDGVAGVDPDVKIVRRRQSRYSGDVWNAINQWVFIQQGLTFEPIEGSGMYTVNNTTTPPSDQTTVKRILRSTQYLQASGQVDLKTQGDAIVADALAAIEKITLQTAPWPAAEHFDVFQIGHRSLPFQPIRRVRTQSWQLPLWGGAMTWNTNVVVGV